MPLINCKIRLGLNWTKNCVMSNIAKICVSIVTLSTKDNVKLTKQLNEGFKKPAYSNKYKTKIESKNLHDQNLTRFYLGVSFQGVKILLVLTFNNTSVNIANNLFNNTNNRAERNIHRKHFLPRVDITDENVLKDGRNFYDLSIKDQIKKYDEVRKIATGNDYTIRCLLDYQYFKDHYQLIAVDLSKQKQDARDIQTDARDIQHCIFWNAKS